MRWTPAVGLMHPMGWLWGASTPGVTTVSIAICPLSCKIVAAIRFTPPSSAGDVRLNIRVGCNVLGWVAE